MSNSIIVKYVDILMWMY